jgi:hypothetical protein
MNKRFETAMLSALFMSAATITAYAADPTPTPPPTQNQSQVATNPGNPSPATRPPAGIGPSASTPANPSPAAASASAGTRSEDSTYYSKKGFGPAPN